MGAPEPSARERSRPEGPTQPTVPWDDRDVSEPTDPSTPPDEQIEAFWNLARFHARLNTAPGYLGPTPIESLRPPAWAFGATPEHADELAALVVAGTKTATASALWDYEATGESVPEPGEMSIILDGAGRPVALITTTEVEIVPFGEVDAAHAHAEGEGDRSLAHWRDVHERYFTRYKEHDRPFGPEMPIVLERFTVVYAAEGAPQDGLADSGGAG